MNSKDFEVKALKTDGKRVSTKKRSFKSSRPKYPNKISSFRANIQDSQVASRPGSGDNPSAEVYHMVYGNSSDSDSSEEFAEERTTPHEPASTNIPIVSMSKTKAVCIKPNETDMDVDQTSNFTFPKKFFKPKEPTIYPTPTQNKYDPLPIDPDNTTPGPSTTSTTDTNLTPVINNPPLNAPTPSNKPHIGAIYLENVQDDLALLTELKLVTKSKITGFSTKQYFILKPTTVEDHKTITDYLKNLKQSEASAAFFFHRAPEERRHKLVIRGLSSNINPETVKKRTRSIWSKNFPRFGNEKENRAEQIHEFRNLHFRNYQKSGWPH
ncbi:MAG: hypothetical protein I4N51_19125 [Acinetobacter sp.]|nr:hypothetical protein [Acinetobacter sp.]